jgi:hypothetical protein
VTIQPHQDPLFSDDPDLDAANAAAEAKRRRRLVLAVEKAIGPGPVYQGVGKEIRHLIAEGIIDPREHAGTIALARSLARHIDKGNGHNLTGWSANGRDQSPIAEQLRETLRILHPESNVDAFEAWMRDDTAPREEAASDLTTAQPHPPL